MLLVHAHALASEWQPFYLISLCGSPDYMIKLRAFIFGSVVDLYWGYTHTRNYASVHNILKIIKIKFKIFTFYTFSLCAMCFEKHIIMNELLAHLAAMPKSLCNHQLSIVGQHYCHPLSVYIVQCHCL